MCIYCDRRVDDQGCTLGFVGVLAFQTICIIIWVQHGIFTLLQPPATVMWSMCTETNTAPTLPDHMECVVRPLHSIYGYTKGGYMGIL